MKYKWLNRKNNSNLIIFFNGWGMDECVVKHLQPEDYDILMFYDYNTLDTDINFELTDHYSKKYLIAWSMGVMTASLFDDIGKVAQGFCQVGAVAGGAEGNQLADDT